MTSTLADASGDMVFLYIRGRDVVCIDRKEGSFPIRTFVFDIGSRRPLGVGAAGMALLLPDLPEETERILKANSVRFAGYGKDVSVDQVIAIITRGREVGYVAIGDSYFRNSRRKRSLSSRAGIAVGSGKHRCNLVAHASHANS